MQCYHGCTLCLTILTVLVTQEAYALSLSRDTLKTINGNEVYERGYYVSKHARSKQCYYSASSPVGLTRLAQDELKIYEALSNAQKCTSAYNGTTFPEIVQDYLKDYEATSGALVKNLQLDPGSNKAAVVAGDLIGAYRMVRRYRTYIQGKLFRALSSNASSCSSEPNFVKAIENLRPTDEKGPFKRDFHLRMFAIIHTQLQFAWKPTEISQGAIRGMELGPSLRAVHCVEIGVHAIATRFFPVGIEWLELAVTQIQNGDKTIDFNFARSLLQKSVAEHDKYWEPNTPWDLKHVFYKTRLNENNDNQAREWPRQPESDGYFRDEEEYSDISWEVCSGNIQQTEAEKSKLFCWHETQVHSTWKLGPLKVELLARQPFEILRFHQVLNDATIKVTKDYCSTRLVTHGLSSVQDILSPKISFSEGVHVMDKGTHLLSERIAGLKPESLFQIPNVAYPPGGHIRLHRDRTVGEDFQQRIATIIYFFDVPDVGGETVFTASKVLAKAIKGSAILFYNLYKSSRFNYDSKHRSCPIVQGSKWIGTRWVHYDSQTHLQCDLDENSMMEYLVNGKSKYNKQ